MDDAQLPFPRGKYVTQIPAGWRLGMQKVIPDLDYSQVPATPHSTAPTGSSVRVQLVQNNVGASGGTGSDGYLLPSELVAFDLTAVEQKILYLADGNGANVRNIADGVVDEYLASTGVPNQSYFWLVVDGPTKFKNKASAATITAKLRLIADETTPGRVDLQTEHASEIAEVNRSVGYALQSSSTNNEAFRGVFRRPM